MINFVSSFGFYLLKKEGVEVIIFLFFLFFGRKS